MKNNKKNPHNSGVQKRKWLERMMIPSVCEYPSFCMKQSNTKKYKNKKNSKKIQK